MKLKVVCLSEKLDKNEWGIIVNRCDQRLHFCQHVFAIRGLEIDAISDFIFASMSSRFEVCRNFFILFLKFI